MKRTLFVFCQLLIFTFPAKVLSEIDLDSILPKARVEFKQCDENHTGCIQQCQGNGASGACLDECYLEIDVCIELVTKKYQRFIEKSSSPVQTIPKPKAPPIQQEDISQDEVSIDQFNVASTQDSNNIDNMGCSNQPITQDGTPCVNLSLGQSKTIKLSSEECDSNCTDKRYFYTAKNICVVPMKIVYRWPYSNNPSRRESKEIAVEGEVEISCLENGDGCDGQLEWIYCDAGY